MTQTIAITGSAGYIGSNLTDELLKRDYTVIGIDNLSMGLRANFEHLADNPRFTFHDVDVRDAARLALACRGADAIIHLAAYKIPRYGGAIDTVQVNAKGAEHVLEIARAHGTRVLLASTSDVYGKNPKLPFNEDGDSVIGPSTVRRWSYAVSKLYTEHLGLAYMEAHKVPVTILRFFGSYGPREHRSWWGGPQSIFIERFLKREPIEIHGDGRQTRSFTYISDTVAGIVAALESKRATGEVFNIGSNEEIAILDLAHLIYRLMDGKGEPPLTIVPYAQLGKYEDVQRRIPDLSKSKELLGFAARWKLEDGLLPTIAWHRAVAARESQKATAAC